MIKLRLFASDLDNTMFTPGEEPDRASLGILQKWLKNNEITTSYVSGRSLDMVLDVIAEYDLPAPDYIISSVGTCINYNEQGKWRVLESWRNIHRSKWSPETTSMLKNIMSQFPDAYIQPDAEQGEFKLSYRIKDDEPLSTWERRIDAELKRRGLEVNLIISQGGQEPICVDFLSTMASKSKAIEFLVEQFEITKDNVVFCGDSGNDEDALTCGIFGILVGGAEKGLAERLGKLKRVYCASSPQIRGILEGLRHFRFMQEVQ